ETYLRHLVVNRSGKLWKPFDRAVAQYVSRVRVVYLPEPDNQSAAIRVGINESLWQSADPGAAPSNMSFALSGTDAAKVQPAVVVIESEARGALTVANVTEEYRSEHSHAARTDSSIRWPACHHRASRSVQGL